MSWTDWCENELKLAGMFDDDGFYGGMDGVAVMEVVKVIAEQGHSGMSMDAVRRTLSQLMKYEPLTPLTGEDDEWEDSYGMIQNKRCFRVFKNEDGSAYDSQCIAFDDGNGNFYTCKDSRVPVTFPYMPKTEIVKRGANNGSN